MKALITGLTVFLSISLFGCNKSPSVDDQPAKIEKKSILDLNQDQIKFVLNMMFEDSVADLSNQKKDAKHARALHNYNIIQAVDARTLAAEYNENEVAADQKFKKKGTYIYVKGTVSKISKDFKGEPYVSLKGESIFNEVQAKFGNADLSTLSKLKPGQKVDFVCEVSNKIVTMVILRECNTLEAHTEQMRAGIGLSVLEVMEEKTKASQDGSERIAAMYLISKQLPSNSSCFMKIGPECEKEVTTLLKTSQSSENQAAFKTLVTKWSNGIGK